MYVCMHVCMCVCIQAMCVTYIHTYTCSMMCMYDQKDGAVPFIHCHAIAMPFIAMPLPLGKWFRSKLTIQLEGNQRSRVEAAQCISVP